MHGWPSYVLALLAVSLLIALHEYGHLVAARLLGMKAERYSLGFGPILLRRQWGETEYVLSAIPFGGYVQVMGMSPADTNADQDPRSYASRSVGQRFLVVLAGPLTNWLLAAVLIFFVALSGMPDTSRPEVGAVLPNSAAQAAGLQAGDLITEVDGEPVHDFPELVRAVHRHPGESVALLVQRGTQSMRIVATLPAQGALLGVESARRRYTALQAIPASLLWTLRSTADTAVGLVDAFSHPSRLQGPIRTVQFTAREAERGWESLVSTMAAISLALAIFNALPLPALDGGRMLFLAYEAFFRRPVSQKIEGLVHATGFFLLIGLIVALSVRELRPENPGKPGPAPATAKP
jgi:regulator of sigma E protease